MNEGENHHQQRQSDGGLGHHDDDTTCILKYDIATAVNPSDQMKSEFLHLACERDSLEAVQYLLEELHVDVECENDSFERNTPLHSACRGGSLCVVKYLVEKAQANINARNYEDWTPLHFACFGGHLDIIEYLVAEQKVQIQSSNNNDNNDEDARATTTTTTTTESPLQAACLRDNNTQVIQYMLPYSDVDENLLKKIWDVEKSWMTRETLWKMFATSHIRLSSDYVDQFPLHAVLQCPHPTEEAYLDSLNQYGTETSLKTMDTNGRLPLHVALDAVIKSSSSSSSTCRINMTSNVLLRLIEMEPRAVSVKDPITGLCTFEVVAKIMSSSSSLSNEQKVDNRGWLTYFSTKKNHTDNERCCWLTVMYTLLQNHDLAVAYKDSRIFLYSIQQKEREKECRQLQDTLPFARMMVPFFGTFTLLLLSWLLITR